MEYKGKRIWTTNPADADRFRQSYLDGIQNYILRKHAEAKEARTSDTMTKQIEERRAAFRKMLGVDAVLGELVSGVYQELIGEDDICHIYRLTVPVTKEIPMYALFMVPKNVEIMPLVIAQHGGGGTPELCCDYVGKNNYSRMVQRVLERGAAVIAPQLLLWSLNESETMRKHEIPFDRRKLDHHLKRLSRSMTGLEIAGIIRCVDFASQHPKINAEKIGMIGLSYGGYFTLYTMAADPRIKTGYAAGFFNDRNVYDWSDWCYKGSACSFHDAEVAALCIPRKLCIAVGKTDSVFDYQSAIPEGKRAEKYYEMFGCRDNIRFVVWDGAHTMENTDEGYEFFFEPLR